MFEITNDTLKEMNNIKETCKEIDCLKCNYFDEINEKYGYTCKLNYPFNWSIESSE